MLASFVIYIYTRVWLSAVYSILFPLLSLGSYLSFYIVGIYIGLFLFFFFFLPLLCIYFSTCSVGSFLATVLARHFKFVLCHDSEWSVCSIQLPFESQIR